MNDGEDAHSSEQLAFAREEAERLRVENARLRALLGLGDPAATAEASLPYTLFPLSEALPKLDDSSSARDKAHLIRSLFHGREDVYAVRWTSARTGKVGYSPAVAGGWAAPKTAKDYLPLTDDVIEAHLAGTITIGVYPLMKDDVCAFLACDFDGAGWILDALAFYKMCAAQGVPAYIERSRSGDGAHVWVFFGEPVEAAVARRLGSGLLRETMIERAEVDLESYDRLFPSQDFVPKGSFGNLIALPLQGASRQSGFTEFLDPATLEPWSDQWAFLSGVRRLARSEARSLADAVRTVDVGPRWGGVTAQPVRGQTPAPTKIECVLGAMISVERAGLPPALLSAIKHLATLHNPEFYKRQKLRFSTFHTPRFIRCYDEDLTHLHLPRGVLEELGAVARRFGSELSVTDVRISPPANEMHFVGTLQAVQERAVTAMLSHDEGVLVAPPGSGKTVMGCAAIAARGLPTLVLVHRAPLLDQWREQLSTGLGIPLDEIGQMGRGKDKRTEVIDVVMIQSLRAVADLGAFFRSYGFLVIDECHHVPAVSFEACVKQAPVQYVLGLTATPYRKDGLDDLITMQCGPIRHEVEREKSDIGLELRVEPTTLALAGSEELSIQEIFRHLIESEDRNRSIVRDVVRALSEGRRCLVLSQWKEHVEALAALLRDQAVEPIVMEGGMGKKRREHLLQQIAATPPEESLVIISTGQYIGEGFDCPQLDALFLAFPVAFKGKLVQYTGRILRAHEGKRTAVVFDYVDAEVPVLKAMFAKRLRAYRSLGFEVGTDSGPKPTARRTAPATLIDFDGYWIRVSSRERPAYEIAGKYLFFSKNKEALVEIAQTEILQHGFHRAKVNAGLLGANEEYVLCLYYRDDSRNAELAARAEDYRVKFRYWKSDADTRRGRYSAEFLDNLDPETREHFTRDPESDPP